MESSNCILTRLVRNFFGSLLDAIGHSRSLGHAGGSCRLLRVDYAFGGVVEWYVK